MIAKHFAGATQGGGNRTRWLKTLNRFFSQDVCSFFVLFCVLYHRVHGKLSLEVTCASPSLEGKKMVMATRMFMQYAEILPTLSNVISNEKANIF